MVYLMFIAELSEDKAFKLLPMITPYSNSLLSCLFFSQINFKNNILKALNVLDFSLKKF